MSQPSQMSNWFVIPPCLWDKGPPPHMNTKVYGGIHTLPPSRFEPITSKEKTCVLNREAHSDCCTPLNICKDLSDSQCTLKEELS